ncbi:MAG: sodium:solute symporter family transporter [Kiritimatiellia bacterium]
MQTSFGVLNLVILSVYLLAMLAIGLWFMRRQESEEAYFLASRAMPWLPVAMSMFASLTSAVTYIGLPARAYAENVSLIIVCLVSPLLVPILALGFYPAYRRSGVTTSYEYIGRRYGPAARTMVSGLFVLARLGWMGTVIYAPAMALAVATGLPLGITIVLLGGMATAYTALGGLAAVLWTDVVQFVILVAGAIWVAVSLTLQVDGGVSRIFQVAAEAGHLDIAGLRPSLFKMSALVVGVSFFLQMMQDYGTDQVTVQRMLAIKQERGVLRATLFNAATDFFMIALLLFIGLGLLAFYQVSPPATTVAADAVLPYYIVHYLPAGLSGLLISAIFAAAMSSMDSGINSLTTVVVHDFIKPVRKGVTEGGTVLLARWITVGFGVLATALAFQVSRMENIVDAFATFMGLFNAPVLALFLLGIFSPGSRFGAWCVSVPMAIAATLYAKHGIGMHWVYFFPVGFVVSFGVAWGLGLVLGPPGGRGAARGRRRSEEAGV